MDQCISPIIIVHQDHIISPFLSSVHHFVTVNISGLPGRRALGVSLLRSLSSHKPRVIVFVKLVV